MQNKNFKCKIKNIKFKIKIKNKNIVVKKFVN